MKKSLFIVIAIAWSFGLSAQHTLTVEVNGIEKVKGQIFVGLANDPNHFAKKGELYKGCVNQVDEETVICTFEDIPEGTYAVSTFHDANGNDELDVNFVGIPRENFGFSNNPRILFKKPSFQDCSFQVQGDTQISIQLNWLSRTTLRTVQNFINQTIFLGLFRCHPMIAVAVFFDLINVLSSMLT